MELTRFFLFSCVTRPERVSGVRQVGEGPHMTPCVTSAPLALLWGELSTAFEVGPSPLAARPAIEKKKKNETGQRHCQALPLAGVYVPTSGSGS